MDPDVNVTIQLSERVFAKLDIFAFAFAPFDLPSDLPEVAVVLVADSLDRFFIVVYINKGDYPRIILFVRCRSIRGKGTGDSCRS